MKKMVWIVCVFLLISCQQAVENTSVDQEFSEEIVENQSNYTNLEDMLLLNTGEHHNDRIHTSDSNRNYVVVGSSDGSISLWDHDGNLINHKKTHSRGVEEVEIHSSIYSISDDNQLMITDIETFEQELLYQGVTKEFTVSHDETLIAISSGEAVKIFTLSDFSLIYEFDWTNGCFDVRFSSDNKFLYNVGHNGKVEKYELSTGELIQEYDGLTQDVHCLELTSDDQYIVAGATDQNVAIWHEDGTLVKKYRHLDGLYDVAISFDNDYIASVGADSSLIMAELKTGEYIKKITSYDELHTATFTNTGVVMGGYDQTIYFYGEKILTELKKITRKNISEVKELKVISAHDEPAFSLAVSHDNNVIATSSFDKKLRLWDVKTGGMILEKQFEEMAVDLVFTKDDKTLIYKGEYGQLLFIDMVNEEVTLIDDGVGSFALSNDGLFIGMGFVDGSVKLFSFPTLEEQNSHQVLSYPVFQLEFSNDDKKLYYAYAGGTENFSTTALDIHTFEKLYETDGHEGYNYDIKSTEEYFITTGADHNIKFWHLEDGSLMKVLDEHHGKVMDVSVSSDEKWLASCSAHDFTMRLWDYETGENIKTFQPRTEVQCVVIAQEDEFVATIGVDGKVRIYGIE